MFSVLDIKQAYHQIPVAQKSQCDLTINTHIEFKRLPNGIMTSSHYTLKSSLRWFSRGRSETVSSNRWATKSVESDS